jgi:LytS/YehU family sensor histidine kinase
MANRVEVLVANKSDGPAIASQAAHPRHGIGLDNVRDRLQAAYSDESEFSFRNIAPGEYQTVMRFPSKL